MKVLQWPETSTPSITSLSCVFRFSGRISDFSWIMVSAELLRLADHDGAAVERLQPGAPVRVGAVEPENAPRVQHRMLGRREIGAQVRAAALADVFGIDLGRQDVDIEEHVAKHPVCGQVLRE